MVAADGSRTEAVTGLNRDGSVTSMSTTVTSADAQTRRTASDLDGDGVLDRVRVAQTTTDGDGTATTTVTTFNGADTLSLGAAATSVSADGLIKITRTDVDGDGGFDRTVDDTQYTNPRGGQTEDVLTTSADGTLLGEALTSRSTDGVSRSTATRDGAGNLRPSRVGRAPGRPGCGRHCGCHLVSGRRTPKSGAGEPSRRRGGIGSAGR